MVLAAIACARTPEAAATHEDPVAAVVLALAIILAAAKLGGHLAVRVGQPAVLGELVAGVALGSADLAGIGWFHAIERDQSVDVLARLGVLILLFEWDWSRRSATC
jgi:Kef-type K+ transport system membrane component KefB